VLPTRPDAHCGAEQAIEEVGSSLSADEVKALFAAADTNDDGTVDYKEFVNLMTPVELGCAPGAGKRGREAGTQHGGAAQGAAHESPVDGAVIDTAKDLGWEAASAGAAARAAAEGAIDKSQAPAHVKVVKINVTSPESIRKVVELEGKVADLEKMLRKEQAVAERATAAASAAASAAEAEARRRHVEDVGARQDDSADWKRDLEHRMGSHSIVPACKQRAVAMRVAAAIDQHRLASVSSEMQEDEDEDKREEEHSQLIAQAAGAVQQLLAASSKVVEKERAALDKVRASLGSFDPPDCVELPPHYTIHADKKAWAAVVSEALQKVRGSRARTCVALPPALRAALVLPTRPDAGYGAEQALARLAHVTAPRPPPSRLPHNAAGHTYRAPLPLPVRQLHHHHHHRHILPLPTVRARTVARGAEAGHAREGEGDGARGRGGWATSGAMTSPLERAAAS